VFVIVVVAKATLTTVSVPVVVVDSTVLYTVGVVIEEKQDCVSVPVSWKSLRGVSEDRSGVIKIE
jgi:hypothetical protein